MEYKSYILITFLSKCGVSIPHLRVKKAEWKGRNICKACIFRQKWRINTILFGVFHIVVENIVYNFDAFLRFVVTYSRFYKAKKSHFLAVFIRYSRSFPHFWGKNASYFLCFLKNGYFCIIFCLIFSKKRLIFTT